MRRGETEELIRLLAGELPPREAAALSARLAREPELAATFRRLEATWRVVEPPPAAAMPPAFARELMVRVRHEAAGPEAISWSIAPAWVRAAGAAALAAGLALGVGLATLRQVADDRLPDAGAPAVAVAGEDGEEDLPAPSLAAAYLEAVADETGGEDDPLAGRGAS